MSRIAWWFVDRLDWIATWTGIIINLSCLLLGNFQGANFGIFMMFFGYCVHLYYSHLARNAVRVQVDPE